MAGITSGVKGQVFAHELVDPTTGKIVKVKDIGTGGGGGGDTITVDSISDATPLGKSVLKAINQETALSLINAAPASAAFKTAANSANRTEGTVAGRSLAAQYLFAYPHGTTPEQMYNPEVKLRIAEVGSVPVDVSGSGREVVYIKGTASPGASAFPQDFVIKVYLNEDGTTSLGIGETGAELTQDGDIKGSIWGEGGMKAYIDSRFTTIEQFVGLP